MNMISFICFGVGFGIMSIVAYESIRYVIAKRKEKQQASRETASSIQGFVGSMAALVEKLSSLERLQVLVEGMESMCKELCRSNDAFIKCVETFQKSIDGSHYSGESEEEEDLSDDEEERRRLLRSGSTPEQVEARLRERRMYRSLKM